MSPKPEVTGFFEPRTSSIQYVVADPQARKCAIVDPVQKDRILRILDRATAAGAELVGCAAAPGCFIAPGYLRNIAPANPGMVEEIFGPIATLSTFRTPDEAADLANNTRYGLAASVWSESATVATDMAARIKAGVVWVNCANLFDAAAPFGGLRDSGYGREGGREGMLDYLAAPVAAQRDPAPSEIAPAEAPEIDRTVKLYIGGAQKRPDGGASYAAQDELVPLGNRKDIRNAVEAAQGALAKWQGLGGHGRAQVLYFLESNTRGATVIGAIVGGGIGLLLTQAIQTQKDWEDVAYYMVLIVLMVMAMDSFSGWLRRRLIKG
mgnify:CR=1 FL=1